MDRINHTCWVAIATPTDRPKSVRNRWVIEVLVASVLSLDFHFLMLWGLCHRTGSDLFLYLFAVAFFGTLLNFP